MLTTEQVAGIANELNRLFCVQIGDNSQPGWEDAPDWHRNSLISGVKAIIDNPDSRPEESHEGWLECKRKDGWGFGPVKDAEKKEHPCFVPFSELPVEQKAKDHLFTGTVKALIPLIAE